MEVPQDAGAGTHQQVERGGGGPFGGELLPQSSPDVVHRGAGHVEQARVLDPPVAVDGVPAFVLHR